MKKYDTGLFCGRFQHIHIGHEHIIDMGLQLCEKLLLFVGSSQESKTKRNPFDVNLRIELINEIYKEEVEEGRLLIIPLKDLTNDGEISIKWGRYLLDNAKLHLGKEPDLMIYGNDDSRSHWFDKNDIKNISEMIIARSMIDISATKMREFIKNKDIVSWQKYSNPKIHQYFFKLYDELTKNNKKIYLLLGPSGSGKSTLSKILKFKGIPEIVTCTTRKPRKGEVNGVDYYFLNEEEFFNTELIESAEYSGNWYGIPKFEIENKLNQYNKIFAIIEKQGVEAMLNMYGNDIVQIIYLYCSKQTLFQRMIDRGDNLKDAEDRLINIVKDNELNNFDIANFIINTDNNVDINTKLIEFIIDNS